MSIKSIIESYAINESKVVTYFGKKDWIFKLDAVDFHRFRNEVEYGVGLYTNTCRSLAEKDGRFITEIELEDKYYIDPKTPVKKVVKYKEFENFIKNITDDLEEMYEFIIDYIKDVKSYKDVKSMDEWDDDFKEIFKQFQNKSIQDFQFALWNVFGGVRQLWEKCFPKIRGFKVLDKKEKCDDGKNPIIYVLFSDEGLKFKRSVDAETQKTIDRIEKSFASR